MNTATYAAPSATLSIATGVPPEPPAVYRCPYRERVALWLCIMASCTAAKGPFCVGSAGGRDKGMHGSGRALGGVLCTCSHRVSFTSRAPDPSGSASCSYCAAALLFGRLLCHFSRSGCSSYMSCVRCTFVELKPACGSLRSSACWSLTIAEVLWLFFTPLALLHATIYERIRKVGVVVSCEQGSPHRCRSLLRQSACL